MDLEASSEGIRRDQVDSANIFKHALEPARLLVLVLDGGDLDSQPSRDVMNAAAHVFPLPPSLACKMSGMPDIWRSETGRGVLHVCKCASHRHTPDNPAGS
jgi:hypothetical protein